MKKQVIYGREAREKLLSGAEKLCRAVTTTLGPLGNNVSLDKSWGAPNVIHDGVSVAKEIELEDKFENMGAQLVKEAASKTNDEAGDGTTTATLLATEIFKSGFQLMYGDTDVKLLTKKPNAMLLKTQIQKTVTEVIQKLKDRSTPLKKADIGKIATLSSQDPELGKTIAEAFKLVGDDGIIEIEESNGTSTTIQHSKGLSLDTGSVSPYFLTGDQVELKNPYILITSDKLYSSNELLSILQEVSKNNDSLLIIADEIESEALTTLIVNKMKGYLNVAVVKAPAFGDRRKALLEDLAVAVNTTVFSKEIKKLSEVKLAELGKAQKVVVTQRETRIIGNTGDITQRVKEIKEKITDEMGEFEKSQLKQRIAKLTGGVAVIKIGAFSETEIKNLIERAKDAIGATRSALAEGIVEGGGATLYKISQELTGETDGEKIIKEALAKPLQKILENAGLDTIEPVNVLTGETGDLIKMGIIDPTKVLTSALQNAASVAVMLLTTDCLVTDIEEEKDK